MKAALVFLLAAGCVAEPDRPDPRAARGWTQLSTADQPGQLRAARMVYDESRGLVVLYGGQHRTSEALLALGATYAFDGTQWNPICDQDVPPPPRHLPAFTYVPDLGLVMAGGSLTSDLTAPLDEVYVCDVSTNRWRPHASLPEGRVGAALIYDPQRRQLMLVGGESEAGNRPAVWLSPDAVAWSMYFTPPFPTGGAAMSVTYDVDARRLLAVEATTNRDGPSYHDALWQLYSSDSSWLRICESCSGDARTDTSIVHIPGTRETYMLNGFSFGDELAGTWILDQAAWVRVATNLPARDSVALAFDRAHDQLIVYGGNGTSCDDEDCAETWVYAR